ncbi:MAG: TonB-dependent receptor, partial [Proteobacteria bacterium]
LWRFPQKGPTDALLTNASLRIALDGDDGLSGWIRAGWHVQDQDIGYLFGSNVQKSPDASAGLAWKPVDGSVLRINAWAQSVNFDKYNGASCWFQPTGTRCPSTVAVSRSQVNGNVLQYFSQFGALRYRERGASAVWSQSLPLLESELQVGADWRRLSGTDAETFYLAPTVFTAPQGNLGSRTAGAGVQAFTGAFAQLALAPLPSFDVRFAARFDRWTNTDRLSSRTTASGIVTGGPFPDSDKSAFNPSLAARWQATEGLALRAAAYRAFRAPGFNNTLRSFGATQPTIANPELEPETLRGWETGADLAAGAWTFGATYFSYEVDDQIATFRVNGFATAPARFELDAVRLAVLLVRVEVGRSAAQREVRATVGAERPHARRGGGE